MADLYDEVYAVLRGMQEEKATADMLLGSTPYYAEMDFSCGGIETAEPTIAHYLETMGFTVERSWTAKGGYEDHQPDLMSAVRDVARGG